MWLRILLAIASAIMAIWGGSNAYQQVSFAADGEPTTWWNIIASGGPLLGAVVAGIAAVFSKQLLPIFGTVSSQSISEAFTAVLAWAADKENPKKRRAARLECIDVLLEMCDDDDAEIAALFKQASMMLHAKELDAPKAVAPEAAPDLSARLSKIEAALSAIVPPATPAA
jgi:hypothetical protein